MKFAVSIVIVTYNSERHIEACLKSVLEQPGVLERQVIVLDNNSSDDTVEIVRRQFPKVELILPGRNLGFAAGVNRAVAQSDAEFVLLLNPDSVILNNAVDTLVAFARTNPGYGIYGGRTLKPDGSLEPSSCWGTPTLWSLAMFATGLSTLAPRNRILAPESLGAWNRDTVREVGVVTGCLLLMKKAMWDQLGGFDERYFMYGEDVDLAMRAKDAGYRLVICPDAKIVHEVGQSSENSMAKMLLLYRGKATLLRTHWRGGSRKVGLLLLATGVGLRALLSSSWFVKSAVTTGSRLSGWMTLWKTRRSWIHGYSTTGPEIEMSHRDTAKIG